VKADDRDNELAAAAAKGNRAALDELLRRNSSMVHAVCRRVLANPDDALDATQEALIAIARRIETFDGRSKFTTWCYRVATNAALDEARRRARRPSPVEVVSEPRTRGPSLDETVADQLDIDAALAQLSPEYRAAVALRDLVGLDYAEIATILDIPPGTVRSRIARGRAALAAHLSTRESGTRETGTHETGGNQTPPSEHPTPRAL
jgi:RNA polymerase sigma-70 factor (ECF subfamily)